MKYVSMARELLKHPYLLELIRKKSLEFGKPFPDIDAPKTLSLIVLAGIQDGSRDDQSLEKILSEAIRLEKSTKPNAALLSLIQAILFELRLNGAFGETPVGGDPITESIIVLILQRGIESYFIVQPAPVC